MPSTIRYPFRVGVISHRQPPESMERTVVERMPRGMELDAALGKGVKIDCGARKRNPRHVMLAVRPAMAARSAAISTASLVHQTWA